MITIEERAALKAEIRAELLAELALEKEPKPWTELGRKLDGYLKRKYPSKHYRDPTPFPLKQAILALLRYRFGVDNVHRLTEAQVWEADTIMPDILALIGLFDWEDAK